MKLKLFTKFQAEGENPNILRGVSVCEIGEAKGHGFALDEAFLDKVVELGNKQLSIKVRLDHPKEGEPGTVLSIVGEASNFRRDGDKVRADVSLFDTPVRSQLAKLAEEASEHFGMSIDFVMKKGKKLKSGLQEVLCDALLAVDFVESPAATSALFNQPVDSTNNYMKIEFSPELLKSLNLPVDADEKTILAAISKSHTLSTKFAEDEKKKEDDKLAEEEDKKEKEKLAEEEKKKEEELAKDEDKDDEKMAAKIQSEVSRLVAKEITAHFAKLGVNPRASATAEETARLALEAAKKNNENHGLTDEEVTFAKKLGIDAKAYSENLAKAKASVRI